MSYDHHSPALAPFHRVCQAVEWATAHVAGPCVLRVEDKGYIEVFPVGAWSGWYWGWRLA